MKRVCTYRVFFLSANFIFYKNHYDFLQAMKNVDYIWYGNGAEENKWKEEKAMKKVLFVGNVRYLGAILIVMQGVLLALLAIFTLNSQYQMQWEKYLEDGTNLIIYLDNISEQNKNAVEEYLYNEADEKELFIVRKDTSLNKEGIFGGFSFGVYGNVDNKEVSLNFYGRQIINEELLKKLLFAEDDESTLGIDNGSVYSVGDIPSFRFYEKTIFKKLSKLIEDSNTINGTYVILGLEDQERGEFLGNLASVCHTTQEDLTSKMRGSVQDDSFRRTILYILVLSQIFLNTVFFLVITIRNLGNGGKLALLGWSRTMFCAEILGVFVGYAVINIPIQIVIELLLSGWSVFSGTLVSYFIFYAVINILLVGVELIFSVLVHMAISPLNAIKGRIPKRILYFMGVIAYLLVSAGIAFCGIYVDGPAEMISENAKLSQQWESVSEYQILKNISVGEDEGSFTGNSKELDQALYNWYKSISKEDGVYLINTTYYDSDILNLWENYNVYEHTPKKAFWYFACSPNYVEKLNLNVDEDVLEAADRGARIYLIPDNYTKEERNNIEGWLLDSSVEGIQDGDIDTVFNDSKEVLFVSYSVNEALFTWATQDGQETESVEPIIYICTPENMKYFETESLRALGLDGYIKFADEMTAEIYTNNEILEKYDLNDNNLVFADVNEYIDGLQKDLMTTIMWFGLVFFVLLMIVVGILIALATVFRIANQERINVKKFLGYGFIHLYGKPFTALVVVICCELVVMVIARSKFGFLLMAIAALIQIVIFSKYMTKCELKNILTAFKGD